jgi:glycosyltransferase involved in cell wall biosynthesis
MKISIITITYNAGKFLEKTMLSVLQQTCKDFEYIIVDGASKDKTVEIITNYELRITNGGFPGVKPEQFRWVSEPDKGLYDAMNKGMDLATGDFVWFVNAGDLIYNEHTVQAIVNAYSEAPMSDIIYGQCLIIDEGENALGERHKIAPKQLKKNCLLQGLVVCHQSILVKKSIAPKYDLKYRICADYDWTIRVVEQSKMNAYMDQHISKFLINGVSSQQRKKAWRERFSIMKKEFGWLKTLWAHFIIILKYPFTRKY